MANFKNVIYGDTDSAYCTMIHYLERRGIKDDNEKAIEIADMIGEQLNESMPRFLSEAFLIPEERGRIVEAGREVVATRGLFKDKKKRYALHVIDEEGKPKDKLKIMGMEVRRSDTPRFIQVFLEELIGDVVREGLDYDGVRAKVDEFRKTFRKMDPWRQGSPGRVKNLGKNEDVYNTWRRKSQEGVLGLSKPLVHITVKAAINTNALMEKNQDHRWDKIREGDKVEVIYLKDNPMGMDAVAIRTGELYVPEWFKELPFDVERMEEKLVDKKLFNTIGDILSWDFSPPKNHADKVMETEDFY